MVNWLQIASAEIRRIYLLIDQAVYLPVTFYIVNWLQIESAEIRRIYFSLIGYTIFRAAH